MKKKKLSNGIIGLVLGDALGVPVEFQSREKLRQSPVTNMQEFGTYFQPKGTWSDDTSLTLSTIESLKKGFSLRRIAKNFIRWKNQAAFTPHGEVFDIGNTTRKSIEELAEIIKNKDFTSLENLKYQSDEFSNGNGSLMRILPLYFDIRRKGVENEFHKIWSVSALTHRHIRSAIACLIYLVLVDEIIQGKPKELAYLQMKNRIFKWWESNPNFEEEKNHFSRIIEKDIALLSEDEINSSGYVMDSLEASIWCLLTTDTYKDSVLKAVNLGEDTDTTAAITGGLSGIYYGEKGIPKQWWDCIIDKDYIYKMAKQMDKKSFFLSFI